MIYMPKAIPSTKEDEDKPIDFLPKKGTNLILIQALEGRLKRSVAIKLDNPEAKELVGEILYLTPYYRGVLNSKYTVLSQQEFRLLIETIIEPNGMNKARTMIKVKKLFKGEIRSQVAN